MLLGSREFVGEARRWRNVLGGGLRQAGVLAAAASYALDHHVERLAEGHANAGLFAEALDGVPGPEIAAARTNMVFARAMAGVTPQDLVGRLAAGCAVHGRTAVPVRVPPRRLAGGCGARGDQRGSHARGCIAARLLESGRAQ
ncbi:beta-eliminating lyase-related protein [Streptomyces sp. NPDC052109]|uniref:beta-eliminating lyase-related protein n=1 Tax=Streptomyces sp. NPDC052109 TaxID=3155527 RepID=UPI0034306A02